MQCSAASSTPHGKEKRFRASGGCEATERRARRALSDRAKAAERRSEGREARERRARDERAEGAKRGSGGREASERRAPAKLSARSERDERPERPSGAPEASEASARSDRAKRPERGSGAAGARERGARSARSERVRKVTRHPPLLSQVAWLANLREGLAFWCLGLLIFVRVSLFWWLVACETSWESRFVAPSRRRRGVEGDAVPGSGILELLHFISN